MRIEGATPSPVVQGVQGNKSGERQAKEHIKEAPIKPAPEVSQKKASEEEIIKAIETANKSVRSFDRRLEFSIHEKTKEIMVKVIDTNTDEVIREIPREKILDMVAKMWEMAGILVDEKV